MIEIKLFSYLEISLPDASALPLQVRKTGQLLAYLACFPERTYSRSHLATLFWPDAEETAARGNLRTSLNELRKRLVQSGLPPEALKTTSQEVTLNADYLVSDVGMFRAAIQRATSGSPGERKASLERAVGLYRGHLLEEFAIDWVEQERSVLAAMCQQALTRLVAWYREEKAQDRALDFAQQAVRLDPYDSDTHLQLMGLCLETRDYDQAIMQYAKMERQLKKIGMPLPPEAYELRRRAFAARNQETLATRTAGRISVLKPSNLRPALTQFFGRKREREQLGHMLGREDLRLITLTGPGGSGKTRLALEKALETRSLFDCRTFWVDMLEIDHPDRIVAHIAQTLLPESAAAPSPLARLQRSLGSDPILLVLDNFEHLVEGGNLQIVDLLTSISPLKILVTSRQPLLVQGEQVFPVVPLPTPGVQQTVEELRVQDSVRLFEDRARSVRSTFALNADNAPALARICNALEGIPLALEIAATWCNTLTPDVIAQAMDKRFDLLVNPLQDAVSRHASLWKVIDWSYQQLSPELQRLFASLSVFRGGWTLAAVTAICSPEATALALRRLQEQSLVTMREVDGEPRFFFLETLREFADLHLSATERQELLCRHADYFLQFALSAQPHLRSAALPLWLERLAHEHDNLLLALNTWKTTERYDHYLRLAAALKRYWVIRDYGPLGCTLIQAGLDNYVTADAIRADALETTVSCSDAHDTIQSRSWLEECLQISRKLGDRHRSAEALYHLSRLQDPHNQALLEQALVLYQEEGDKWGEANCLHTIGGRLFTDNEHSLAESTFQKCLRLREQVGDRRGLLFTYVYLGNISLLREDFSDAKHAYEHSLVLARELKNGFTEGWALIQLARIDYICGRLSMARQLTEQGLKLLEEAYAPIYEIKALVFLALITRKQSDTAYAHHSIQVAADRLLAQSTQSVHFIRTGTDVLRAAVLVMAARNEYEKAAKLMIATEAIICEHQFQLDSLQQEELKTGWAIIKSHLSAEAISALRQESSELSITTALEIVLTL